MAGVVTTTTNQKLMVWGDRRVVRAKLAFDTGDYAAGGVAVTAAQFGLGVLEAVIPQGCSVDGSSTALLPSYNPATGKVMLFEAAASGAPFIEKGAEAFVSGTVLYVLAIGY